MSAHARLVVVAPLLAWVVVVGSPLSAQQLQPITLEKATNGMDADVAPGPALVIGSPVTWTYVVTNTGDEVLNQVRVVDDQVGAVSCPKTTLAVQESMTCTAAGTVQAGQYANLGTAAAVTETSLLRVSDVDPSHYFGVLDQPAIDLEKATDGFDADTAPGPFLPIGLPVSWTYLVTNTGNVSVGDISVADDQMVSVFCPQSFLDPGAFMVCTAFGTAQAGQYANVGTVTGFADVAVGGEVSDSDPSHYFGIEPGPAIQLEKATNGQDADAAPGPAIPEGDPVTWTYVVSNLTEMDLFNVQVTDDQGVMVNCPGTSLSGNQSMTCTASGTAQLGPYANLGTVTAFLGEIVQVSDTDPSHYVGIPTSDQVSLEKATEGIDADLPPGPGLVIGDPVTWTYVVTNTGPATLGAVSVTDDQGVAVSCPKTALGPGESMTCTASGTVTAGQYSNLGTVTAELPTAGPLPTIVSAADQSHYFGTQAEPAIDLQKATNGVDADSPPGPSIPEGGSVIWTYTVTNMGLGTLTGITVSDDQGVAVSCPGTSLDPGVTMVCTASGTAQAGQYTNVGTATATTPTGGTLTAMDPSHYFGGLIGPIHLEKATNGVDADVTPGPSLVLGTSIVWTYVVTNSGTDPLTEVQVSDSDPGVLVSCPKTSLAPGESMTCTATGTAAEGQYENVGTVTARLPDRRLALTSDPSHYLGRQPSVLEIPAVSEGGLVLFALVLAACGALAVRRLVG